MSDLYASVSLRPHANSSHANHCSAHDHDRAIENKVKDILATDAIYKNVAYEVDPESQHDTNDRATCVFISNFFTDNTNLVYYIRGTRNTEMFLSGMFGMQVYCGPSLCTITTQQLSQVLGSLKYSWVSHHDLEVKKDGIRMNQMKWQYLFETGRLGWDKIELVVANLQEANVDDDEDGNTAEPHSDEADASDGQEEDEPDDGEAAKPPIGAHVAANWTVHEQSNRLLNNTMGSDAPSQSGTKAVNLGMDLIVMFHMDPGSNTSSSAATPGEDTSIPQLDRTTDSRKNLILLGKLLALTKFDHIEMIWTGIRECINRDRANGVELGRARDELYKDFEVLEQRAKVHRESRTLDLNTRRRHGIELACDVSADQERLVQRFANASVGRSRKHLEGTILTDIHSLQTEYASEQRIETFLMNMLYHAGQSESGTQTNPLTSKDDEIVGNVMDTLSLQKDLADKYNELIDKDASPESFAVLEAQGPELEIDLQNYIKELVVTILDYKFANTIPDLDHSKEEDRELTVEEQVLLARFIQVTYQNKRDALALLRIAHWDADAAYMLWSNMRNDDRPSSPKPPSPRMSVKRPCITEAGPSRSKKTRRSQSPEETDEAARARLERIIAEENAAQRRREEQSKRNRDIQRSGKSEQAGQEKNAFFNRGCRLVRARHTQSKES